MMPLVIAMPYFENAGILALHVETWQQYPADIRNTMVVLIADDGSPRSPAVVPDDVDIDIRIYRIGVNKPWNQTGARNLAMHVAPEGWVLVTDIDHVLSVESAIALCALRAEDGRYYVPSRRLPNGAPYKRHPNSYYLTREMYWRTGGCDEDFSGCYGSDSTFRRAIAQEGTRVDIDIPLTLYGRDAIPDASTTDWGRKDSEWHVSNFPHLAGKRKTVTRPVNPLRFPWTRSR